MSQEFLASPKRHQLDSLPVEIIRRIAANGPYSSALSLLQVNHKLYDACNDWTVFKGIIENNANSRFRRPKWEPFTTPSVQPEKSFWASYAFADLKAIQFLDSPSEVAPNQLANWAPHLMAMHHPLLALAYRKQLFESLQGHDIRNAPALSFCLTSCSLSDQLELDGDLTRIRIRIYRELIRQDRTSPGILDALDLDLELIPWVYTHNGLTAINRFHHPSSPTSLILLLAYKALRVFYYELLIAIAKGKISTKRYSDFLEPEPAAIPIPPTAFQIQFSSFMTVPLPFSPSSAELFNNCHLPAMTTPEFIETGEWAGYYCMDLDMPLENSPQFDTPMQGIQFSAKTHEADPNILELRSNGKIVDVMSMFHFEGKLQRDSGKLDLMKCYMTDELNVPIQAIFTPFGIVGSFGERNRGHWIWLWKTEWSTSRSIG